MREIRVSTKQISLYILVVSLDQIEKERESERDNRVSTNQISFYILVVALDRAMRI